MKKYGIGLLLAVWASSGLAGVNQWTFTGPDGGPAWYAKYLSTAPGVAIVTAGDGVYRTTDNGATWTKTLSGAIVGSHVSIHQDPTNPLRVFLAGGSQSLLMSQDGGQTFAYTTNTSLTSSEYTTTAAISADGSAWYVGTNLGKVYRSVDRGAQWQLRNNGLPGGQPSNGIPQIIVDPRNADWVYVTSRDTAALGLYYTSDGGQNWSLRSTEACSTSNFRFCNYITIDPVVPDRMLAATGDGMYRSVNAGVSWTRVDTRRFAVVKFDPVTTGHVIAGTFDDMIVHSTDSGLTWPTENSFLLGDATSAAYAPSFAFDPLQSGRVLLCTRDGVFLSINGGISWSPRYTGILGTGVAQIVSTWGAPPQTIITGATGIPGIYSYQANSQTWSPIGAPIANFAPTARPTAFAAAPSNSNVFYAGGQGGFFLSSDSGNNWVRRATTFDVSGVEDIAVLPSDSQTLYVHGRSSTLHISTNGGATFTPMGFTLPIPNSPSYNFSFDKRNPTTLYAYKYNDDPIQPQPSESVVFKSIDSGANWTPAAAGLGMRWVRQLLVDPTNSAVVYAATNGGLMKSADAAQTWTQLPGDFDIDGVDVDIIHPGHLIRIVSSTALPRELQRSVDGGQNWETVPFTSGSWFLIRKAAFDYTAPSSIITAADSRGIALFQLAPDLELTSSLSAFAINATQSLRLDIRNRGVFSATDIILRTRFPISGARVQSSPVSCTIISLTMVQCPLGTIRPNQTVSVTIDAPEMTSGQVTSEVGGREVDSVMTNNVLTFNVERQSDVAFPYLPTQQELSLAIPLRSRSRSPTETSVPRKTCVSQLRIPPNCNLLARQRRFLASMHQER